MIECDNFIKEHQVNILKCLGIFYITFDGRLAVGEIIIGEVSDKAACKGREIIETGTFIIGKDLTKVIGWVVCFDLEIADLHFAVHTGDLHFRIKAKECISSPSFICLCGFQHIAVCRYIFQYLHRFNGCCEVGKNFTAYRKHIIFCG